MHPASFTNFVSFTDLTISLGEGEGGAMGGPQINLLLVTSMAFLMSHCSARNSPLQQQQSIPKEAHFDMSLKFPNVL